jgi:hypothetical protein
MILKGDFIDYDNKELQDPLQIQPLIKSHFFNISLDHPQNR